MRIAAETTQIVAPTTMVAIKCDDISWEPLMSAAAEPASLSSNQGSVTRVPFASRECVEPKHSVEFYSDDQQLLENLTQAIGSSLLAGDSAVVIATGNHVHQLTQLFAERGFNLGLAVEEGRFIALGAAETLASFMVDGFPDEVRFYERIGDVLRRARFAARSTQGRIVAFGEMVALLAAEGRTEAALRLEQLWNSLQKKQDFHLHCAYPISVFSNATDADCIARVCAAHHEVAPVESYTGLANEKDRSVAIAILQQKATALETEIEQRKAAQQALQRREAELRDFIENAVLPMHWVAADGVILWANQAELDLLGFSREEYVGHHVSEFYPDQCEIHDILQRLGRYEELHGYSARLRCKDGSIRYVQIHSNVFAESGTFIHTRCFTVDVTQAVENERRIVEQHNARQRSEIRLQEVAATLTDELASSQRLQQVSSRLVQVDDFPQLLNEILDAAIDISHTDMGNIQLLDGQGLKIAAHRGFEEPFLHFFGLVRDDESACGAALSKAERVVVEDVAVSPLYSRQSREVMLAAGARAVQSTPLISHSGRVLGMFSTHSRVPKSPDDRELRALDVLARLAADLIDRNQTEDALRHSEQRFRVITDASPVLVWMAGTDKLCYYFNKRWLEFVGRTLEQEIGNGWADNVHPDDFDRCLQNYLSCFDERRPFEMEYRLRHHSGEYRWILDCGVPRYSPDGTFEGYVGGCLDIHDKKEATEVRQRLAAIVDSSNDAIISKDLNGIITSWNSRAEKMFGYSANEIIGRSITTIIPPEMCHDEDMILSKIRSGEKIDHFETVRLTKDGERIEVSLSISPVRDEHGRIIGGAKIARDITENKKMQRALHMTEKLAAAGRLAATVAHEINNPLESVTNFIYLARLNPALPSSARHHLDCADQELSRVAHIARQTLGFYRDNSRPSWIELARVVDDVFTVYQRKFDNKNISFHRQINSDVRIFAVEGELKQVLSNLIANAIDASPFNNQISVRARFITRRDGGRGVRLLIGDSGEGIAAENKKKLFSPFFTTKKEVGTGLGLWITKELVQKAGGSIRLRSRVGNHSGTVFALSFPHKNELCSEQVA
jgi:PAS domain S-box-containing protein